MPDEVSQVRRALLAQAALGAAAAGLGLLRPDMAARQPVWPDGLDLLLLFFGLAMAAAGLAFAWAVRFRRRLVRAAMVVLEIVLPVGFVVSLVAAGPPDLSTGVFLPAIVVAIPGGEAVRLMFSDAAVEWFRVPPVDVL